MLVDTVMVRGLRIHGEKIVGLSGGPIAQVRSLLNGEQCIHHQIFLETVGRTSAFSVC